MNLEVEEGFHPHPEYPLANEQGWALEEVE